MVDVEKTQQQQLVNKHHRVRQKQIRKQLILVSILNLLTFVCFLFSMSFYQWIWIRLNFKKNEFDSKDHVYWINLLYMKQDKTGSAYQSFQSVKQRVCFNNIYCSALIFQLQWTGYLCFLIFGIAIVMQIFQFGRMIYFIWTLGKIKQTSKNFRHIVQIGTYIVGLTLSAFSILINENVQSRFGISYWLCVAVIAIFILIIIYGQISLRKMVKQAIIQNLLDLQKTARCQKLKVASKVQLNNQQKLTI